MASSDVLTETLHTVTGIKLAQLETQRATFERAKRALLDEADAEPDARKRARMLIDGVGKLPAMLGHLRANPVVSTSNIASFVEQAECDPSVSPTFLAGYEDAVRGILEAQSNKYSFASLYGGLVKDWTSASADDRDTAGSDAGAEYVAVGREEMHKQRAMWEGYVLEAKEMDVSAIRTYLDSLFAENPNKEVAEAFNEVRLALREFQQAWEREKSSHFSKETVRGCIGTLLRGDVISDQKRATLNEFLGNDIVLSEMADVLNMRVATMADFSWEDGVTVIEQRRQLNGRYRFYPDEDLLQAIFLELIGLKWATELRRVLVLFVKKIGSFLKPKAGHNNTLSKQSLRRRRFFLGDSNATASGHHAVDEDLARHWRTHIFLDQLPSELFEKRGAYGDDKSGDKEKGDKRGSPLAVVQELIHRVQASIIMRQRLGQDTTVIRSDFKWFGPSLPHSSIFTVLDYFGVNEAWMSFFRKVLEAPLAFKDENGVESPRIRKRGTPIGTPLNAFFGEALLFCSDFAVHQKADGTRLYRLHDDLWLWGDVEACSKGWTALTEFAAVMGLEFNEDKTGSCVILKDGSSETTSVSVTDRDTLPKGDVVWGFLKLDAASGRFVINQPKIDLHIEELELQLKACRSIFDFIQAWNLYGVRFFRTNCGKVAGCFGRRHVDSMLETFKRIQSRVFASSSGSVGAHLKRMVEERLGVKDIPDGFLYYPTSMGGLGLQNPFVDLYMIRKVMCVEPEVIMDQFFKAELSTYREAKRVFESIDLDTSDDDDESRPVDLWDVENQNAWSQPGPPRARTTTSRFFKPVAQRHRPEGEWSEFRDEPFMSFAEYTEHRGLTSNNLGYAYHRLLDVPTPQQMMFHGEAAHASSHGRVPEEVDWTPYERWIIQLYSEDIMRRFGSLSIVSSGLLPIGLMKMLTQSRFKWQN